MKKLNYKDFRYIIIGGSSRAATTSLFGYLAQHPQICPSNPKETRFFLDLDYPLASKFRYNGRLQHKYNDFFRCNNSEQIRLEASPDYLYSINTAHKIKKTLPNIKLLFILREPISRLVSWYKFGRMMRHIPKQMSFDEYVNYQFNNSGSSRKPVNHPVLLALEQGRYSTYLKPFFDLFDRNQINILFYENLRRETVMFMKSMCEFANIDPGFFNDYEFEILNRSRNIRYSRLHFLYVKYYDRIKTYIYELPKIKKILSIPRSLLEPVSLMFDANLAEELIISHSTMKLLREYYADETIHLTSISGITPPW